MIARAFYHDEFSQVYINSARIGVCYYLNRKGFVSNNVGTKLLHLIFTCAHHNFFLDETYKSPMTYYTLLQNVNQSIIHNGVSTVIWLPNNVMDINTLLQYTNYMIAHNSDYMEHSVD